ncbi:MAG: hypothetical protein KBD12_02050 [Candidatus Pacebacteria bacterium]|mgnify:CR=1 FL=1|nr:hypothetical protein [Candidatus Paceibacterota bacterium]
MYLFQTLIEPTDSLTKLGEKEYKVVGQDSCFPVALFFGNYENCSNYQKEKSTC